jgi:hypothetical protein
MENNMETYEIDEFEEISKEVHSNLDGKRSDKKAKMYGIVVEDGTVKETVLIAEHGDIYELLGSKKSLTTLIEAKDIQLIALLTQGWAAPVKQNEEDEIAPSQHPERVRVKMTLIGNSATQYSSVLDMDGKDEIVYSYKQGEGSLADAFSDFITEWKNG